MAAEGVGRYRLYGATIDDAVGEAFDKTAKLLGLPYPGGPQIEALARAGDGRRYALPRPMLGRAGADFSFSGLKTAVRQIVVSGALTESAKPHLAAAFQDAVVDVLEDRIHIAMQQFRTEFEISNGPYNFVAAGGVASNSVIRRALNDLAGQEGFALSLPPAALCTDNGAMVAWAGLERLFLGFTDELGAAPLARWPLQNLDKSRIHPPAGVY